MIVRPYYLDMLKTYRDVPLVKILAGIRRCGKSTILDMLKDDLICSGIAADHVIQLRYTSEELDDSMTAKQMYRDIKEKMTDNERYYLLLDEVQEVDGWEKAVNSLLEDSNTDIYVTGSNSKLMSSEISTYLTGRYISIPVFTLSFAEYMEFKKHDISDLKLPAMFFSSDCIYSNILEDNTENLKSISLSYRTKKLSGQVSVSRFYSEEIIPPVDFHNTTSYSQAEEITVNGLTVFVIEQGDLCSIAYQDNLIQYMMYLNTDFASAIEIAKTISDTES